MYHVIAYHGVGNRKEVERDLRLLWDGLRNFAKSRNIRHIYCFQGVWDKKEANLLFIVQYKGNVGMPSPEVKSRGWAFASDTDGGIPTMSLKGEADYWFYIRERRKNL